MEVDLELYREEIVVSENPLVRLSVIEIAPEEPIGTMVMIHGYGGYALQWQYQLKAFAERYRVIAYDLRGHHHSDAPYSQYTMAEFQSDLDNLLRALKVETPFILLGHSFGGAIAAEFAHDHPQAVARLVLVATTGEYTLFPGGAQLLRLPLVMLRPIRRMLRRQLWAPAHVLKLAYFNAMSRWNGWSMFKDLRMPVLIIRGDRDQVYPSAVFEQVARNIPESEDVNVGVSSHLVMLERAEAVTRAIDRFLGERGGRNWREQMNQSGSLSQERPWLKHYERGVPATLGFPKRPLYQLLWSATHRYRNHPAIQFFGRTLSYEELNQEVDWFAHLLRSIGVEKGTKVMILLPNCSQFVIAYYGILRAGGIVVSSSPVNRREELQRQIEDSGSEVLITLTLYRAMVQKDLDRPPIRAVIYTGIHDYFGQRARWQFLLRRDTREAHRLNQPRGPHEYSWMELRKQRFPGILPDDVQDDEVAVVQYTGGTTDQPKGVILTHRALLANTLQIRHWVTGLHEGRERILCVVPFSHIYGMTAAMNVAIALGGCMIILSSFSTNTVLATIKRHHPTLFPGVPTMYTAINQAPRIRQYNISSIKVCISGAAPLPVEVQEAFEKLTRGRLVEGYGLTEAGPVTHANPLNGLRKVGSIGIPLPGTEARIVNLADSSEPVPQGQIGELAVRGPQIMKGYWGMEEATEKALSPDGWLLTGDVARMDDDGYFQIVSRKKEMILAGKYQVYPRDVEEVLYEHPGIREVAVVGLDRPEMPDQRIKAYVVPRQGVTLTKAELIAFCRRRLEEYAVPWDIEFRDELPKSFVGKILVRLLVEDTSNTETHQSTD